MHSTYNLTFLLGAWHMIGRANQKYINHTTPTTPANTSEEIKGIIWYANIETYHYKEGYSKQKGRMHESH